MPQIFAFATIYEIAAAASQTRAVLPAMPADAYTLAFLPRGDARADLVDHAGDFVSRNARIDDARK